MEFIVSRPSENNVVGTMSYGSMMRSFAVIRFGYYLLLCKWEQNKLLFDGN